VSGVPAEPARCRGSHVEVDRLQWRVGDGDPGKALATFLAAYGLPVDGWHTPAARATDGVCGAALSISAAGSAALAGLPPGPPTPVPAVPDLVAVAYRHGAGRPAPARPRGRWSLGPWRDSWSGDEHAAAVEAIREAIGRGEVYQVSLVGHASAAYRGDPLPALRRVAALPGARYRGLLDGKGWAVACASPETLLRVRGGRLWTRPIKGTAPATPAGRAALLGSAKERAEHVMIVDLERNDLAVVAATGSVRVDELFAVRRWCHLWQAESVVSARLAGGVDLVTLLAALCPGGSVTGAPKRAALHLLSALEPVGRGPAMGAVGWLDHDGMDLGLTIRTVAAHAGRVHVWAGGGITWGSDPAAEVAEAAAKAAPLRAALAG
jgi:para-aminobenzoate synthetase component 1